MRNYQRKLKNKYLLPHNIYMQALYSIRDYERLKQQRYNIIYASTPPDGLPKGKGLNGNPTENKGLRLYDIEWKIVAIETALNNIPEEYRSGVLRNILYGSKYPVDADIRTYQTYKQRFIYHSAIELRLI